MEEEEEEKKKKFVEPVFEEPGERKEMNELIPE
jgi:hypothetical protein